MPCRQLLFALSSFLILFMPPYSASGLTPEAQPLGPLLSRAGRAGTAAVQYYRPSIRLRSPTPSPRAKPGSQSKDHVRCSVGQYRTAPAASRRSHLSSDPRVNTARVLVERNRLPRPGDPAAAGPGPSGPDGRAVSPGPGRQPGVPGTPGRGRATARAPGRGHRGVPVHPDPAAGLVRVRLELALAFYLKEEDAVGPRPFRAGPGGPPACGPGRQHQPVLNIMRARRRWTRIFRVLRGPGYQYQRRVGRGVHLYQRPAVPPGAAGPPVPISAWWAGAAVNTSSPWPNAGACARGSTSTTGSTRGAGSTRRSWGLRGAALADQPEYRDEPAGHREPALVGRLQLQLRLRRAPGSGAPGLRGPAAERPGLVERPQIPAAEVPGRAAHGVLPGRELRALPDRAGQRCWSAISSRRRSHPLDNAGYWTRVGTNVALPWGFTVGLSAEFRWTNYEGGWFPFVPITPPARTRPASCSHAAQPRDHGVRVQPPDRVFQPGARIQRATLRLQTQPRGNALGPAVLKSAPSLLCSGRISCGLPSHGAFRFLAASSGGMRCRPYNCTTTLDSCFRRNDRRCRSD